jgi:2-hydroxy-3-oxopropionate reductase
MSTISPIATRGFARRVEEKACDYLDAPVSGGDVGAKAATLTFMVGGPEAAFKRVLSLFALMGKTITHVGANGDGQTAKAANQIVVAVTIAAVSEALVFASKAGADPAKVRQALLGGFAGSRILEVHAERMLKRTFAPGFRVALHHKDLAIVLDGARKLCLALPHTALCQELFNASIAAGEGGLDDSALVRVIERLANHELG